MARLVRVGTHYPCLWVALTRVHRCLTTPPMKTAVSMAIKSVAREHGHQHRCPKWHRVHGTCWHDQGVWTTNHVNGPCWQKALHDNEYGSVKRAVSQAPVRTTREHGVWTAVFTGSADRRLWSSRVSKNETCRNRRFLKGWVTLSTNFS